ncbi:zinc finger BED domain-containing protein 4-like isoform X1 [Haemaphysalis longicornis]
MQQAFNRYITEMVALDAVPLSLTKGLGFKRLIEFLKPDVNLPSPRTVGRQLEELATAHAVTALAEQLRDCPPGSLHFIVDIWTSRRRNSIMGIRVQFVKDWRLHLQTLPFRYFEGRHTGENIREVFVTEISLRGINQSQVGTVVCDNAANMTKAFDMGDTFMEHWTHTTPDPEDSEEESVHDTLAHATEEEEEETATLFHRVRCAAHTLQLAVNSAMGEDDKAQGLLATLNTVVNVFRRSCLWTERLKKLCGKDVVPAAGTR